MYRAFNKVSRNCGVLSVMSGQLSVINPLLPVFGPQTAVIRERVRLFGF
ncbi:MAG: hypothetical protein WBQ94_08650 [Terracidiphilus sp.]